MTVVITGASAGIGLELARLLSAKGARLALAARRVDRLESLNAELGGGHLVVPCDVSSPDDCRRLIDESARRFERIDTLVCNAGYGIYRSVCQTSPQEVLDLFRTNLFGTLDCVRPAVAVMSQQPPCDGLRGHIMIVSSAAGRRGLPFFGAYAATKAAQLSLAEALRVELRSQRIGVTSVHPIGTQTEFFGVAERLGGAKLPGKSPLEMGQTARQVAAAMVGGIVRVPAEVWPYRPARLALSLATLFPSLADRLLWDFRKRMDPPESPAGGATSGGA